MPRLPADGKAGVGRYLAWAVALALLAWVFKPLLSGLWARYRLVEEFPQRVLISDPQFLDKQFVQSACTGNKEHVSLFLRAGYSPGSAGTEGLRPLHCAAARGDLELIATLLERGADTRATFGDSQLLPVHFAAAYHQLDAIKALVAAGSDINAPSKLGPPLMLALNQAEGARPEPPELKWGIGLGDKALKATRPDMLDQLVALGARTDATDDAGNTLLHLAALTRNGAALDALVAHGLDLNARNQLGETPFLAYVRHASYRMFGHRAYVDDLPRYQHFIELGADVNARDKSGASAILFANIEGDLMDLLLAHGLRADAATSSGVSIWSSIGPGYAPAQVIAFADKVAEVATPTMPDGRIGSTALLVFADRCEPELVEYFLKRGADARIADAWNRLPLDAANKADCGSRTDPAGAQARRARTIELLTAALARPASDRP